MDIKNKLFKFKRAVHRNRETIAKAISITLTVALLVVVAWAAYTIYQSDLAAEAEANNVVVDEDKIPSKSAPKEDLTAFNMVAENDTLKLYANYTDGEIYVEEKGTGKKWYSNPVDRKDDNVVVKKPTINSQFFVNFYDLEKRTEILDWNNYQHSIKKGGMTHELIENGIKFTFAFPTANVYIPVQYTLCEGGFQAEIITGEISGVGSNPYAVTSIDFLPYFGAAGLEEEGELFIPDGSGALIKYNNGKEKSAYYKSQVYGTNITTPQDTADTVKEQISMPVFGSVSKGKEGAADSAFLGVIISGEASSTISARTSKQISSYNMIYTTANLRETKLIRSGTNQAVGVETRVLAMSDDMMNGKNYAVRYYFLNGDDANYVGMAEKYREHLMEKQMLKDSALADDKYLVLDLVGAVSIEKYVFGIKQPVVTALTTYKDVVTIVKELKEKGVEKLIVNYVGALDSGLNNEMFSTVKTESVLGSKKDFKAMIEYLQEQKVQFFLETNPVDLYNNGHGYDTNADAAKTFFDKYAFQYKYILDSMQSDKTARWHILHPAKVPGFVTKFADSVASTNSGNVSLDRLGSVLYTDYAKDVPSTTRTHALELWTEAMKYADEKSQYLMLHGGNAYTLAYADVITDTATGSSDYDMEDQYVPFYQIAFQGNTVLTPTALNTSVDYTREFLRTLETGCSLKYNLIYGEVEQLVGTEYNTMVSYSYAYWKDIIVDQYLKLQSATAQFAGEEIVSHRQLAEDVTLTEYESGSVVVNYRSEPYTYEGKEIAARDYVVITGGTK